MSRYIDADALISDLEYDIKIDQDSLDYEDLSDVNRKLIQNDKDVKQNVVDILKSTPTADVVPVVRCKDCFHSRPDGYGLECTMHYRPTKEEDFCSYGEVIE